MSEAIKFSDKILTFTDEKQWLIALDKSYGNYKRAGWEFFIVLRDGVNQFGGKADKKRILLEQAANQMDLAYTTLDSYYSISISDVASIAYGLGLSFGHAEAVHGHDISYAESLLLTAAEWQWNANKLKNEAWRVKHGKEQRIWDIPKYEEPPVIQQNVLIIPPSRQSDTRELHELVSGVNREKVFTYTGAQALPIAMTPKEHYAMAVYGRATGDMINWTRGDHYNRMLKDAKQKAWRERWDIDRLNDYVADSLADMAQDYHCSESTILINAATALAFGGTRQESAVIGYKHHELLRNSSSEEAADWLTRAERNRWTPEQLDAQMHPHRSNDDAIINIIRGVQGIQLDESQIILTSATGKLVITQWHIE